MTSFDDSLRGYSSEIHQRDNYTCRYCGADGKTSFATWLTLSSDHLLPKGHPERDNPKYIVTACGFCNAADNRYFDKAIAEGFDFNAPLLSPDILVHRRLPYVLKTRQAYQEYWEEKVKTFEE
ncbi:MAG: hypothetical protein H0X30_20300 [Anaerolineae bacterium]|nr:hypothetical protein [Anaerolineae bacterium]